MKNITMLLAAFIALNCFGQTESNSHEDKKKIKVYLLGSFHFAQMDSTYDVLSKEHQNSIEELCNTIVKQKPNKVFVERQPEYEFQNKNDSLYTDYLNGGQLKRKNEMFQIGFRVAKKLGHQKIYQCDHPGRYGYLSKTAIEYAQENDQMEILEGKRMGTIQRFDNVIDEDSLRNNISLFEYIKWNNSDQVMSSSHGFYLANFTQLGSTNFYDYEEDYSLLGAEVVADWYRRNIMIYSKMINQVDYSTDESIFLVMGSDHIPILKSFFEGNSNFEVIHPSKWLTN